MATVDDAKSQASTIIQSLQVGSGVDIQALAQSLAEAENSPRINQIKARQASVEASISGYGLMSSSLGSLRQVFEALGDFSSLFENLVDGGDATVLTVSANSAAQAGLYQIDVTRLASAQTIRSNSFSSTTQELNSGVAFSLDVSIGASSPVSHSIAVTDTTPVGVVDAINEADLGLTATLVNKSAAGDDWYILLQGDTGTESTFSINNIADLGFDDADNVLTSAANAEFSVNGLTGIERASNTIDDAISGLTLSLKQAGGDSQMISVRPSTQPLRAIIDDLVIRFNDLQAIVTELVSADSAASEFAGSLERDKSLANSLMREVRGLFEKVSTSASGGLSTLKDIGLIFQRDGTLALDESIFNELASEKREDVIQMLSAGSDSEDKIAFTDKGLAADAAEQLEALLARDGIIQLRINTAENRASDYRDQLDLLEQRLEAARMRYVQQFAAMEAFVEKSQGMGDYLKGQFEAMRNSNN